MNFNQYRFFLPGIPPAVKYLILVNTGIYLFELLFQVRLSTLFGLTPALFWRGYVWQPITYMFLHGWIFHIVLNMFVLWMFGSALESIWGSRMFLKFYFICGIGAGLLEAVITPNSTIPTVGASGAIYGLIMAFGILFPNQLIYVWGIFPIKAKYFVVVIGILEFLAAMSAAQTNIAHIAHLGGMLFGLVYMKSDDWLKLFSGVLGRKKRKRHLRVLQSRGKDREELQRDIDMLLDKIKNGGIDSLTPQEQERLKKAGKKMAELER